ncbi:hypothetical protein FRC01_009608, partial [Tulasnella sp. 417]
NGLAPEEPWHRECYLINKFWGVRLAEGSQPGPFPWGSEALARNAVQSGLYDASIANPSQTSPEILARRIRKQLSKYEKSSSNCISIMLQNVRSGKYLDAIRMVEKFVLHVEVLFAAIDELERAGAESLSQVNDAETLFRETAGLIMVFSQAQGYLSHSHFPGAENFVGTGTQQEHLTGALLSLTPGLTSHHKNLIMVTLAGAIKLKHNNSGGNALLAFLDRLRSFALDGADPCSGAPRPIISIPDFNSTATKYFSPWVGKAFPSIAADYPEGAAYGYRSLMPQLAGVSPTSPYFDLPAARDGTIIFPLPPSDKCLACLSPIKESCVRFGTYQRWHFHCITCFTCGKSAEDQINTREGNVNEDSTRFDASSERSGGPSTMKLKDFYYGVTPAVRSPFEMPGPPMWRIYCADHAQPELGHSSGLETVSRLEQYAFLLNVAIRISHFLLLGHKDLSATTSE